MRVDTTTADGGLGRIDLDFSVRIGLVYLGAAYMLPTLLAFPLPFMSGYGIVGLFVAWVGWRSREAWPALQHATAWTVAFGAALIVSSVSVWDLTALHWSIRNSVWLVAVVPGVARLMAERKYRLAFLVGLSIGVVAYGLTFLLRLAREGFDSVVGTTGEVQYFLRYNRNDIDGLMLFVLPLSLWLVGGRRPWRWLVAGLSLVWLLTTGGRLGPITLALVGLSYALMQPGLPRRARALVAVLLTGVLLVAVTIIAPPGRFLGTDRLFAFLQGERSQTDEERGLENRVAWQIGWDHPLFGVGYQRIGGIGYAPVEGVEPPALDEASTERMRRRIIADGPHNLYAWYFATTGLPGVLTLFGLLAIVLLAGIRARAAPDARAAVAALIATLVAAATIRTTIELFAYPLALTLGAAGEYALQRSRSTRAPRVLVRIDT